MTEQQAGAGIRRPWKAHAMTFTSGSKRAVVLQGFFRIERFAGGRAPPVQAGRQDFWAGKAPRPELMFARRPASAAVGAAAQARLQSFWAGRAARPQLMRAGTCAPTVQASAWPGAPRPELLPGMGRPELGSPRGVAQRRADAAAVVTSPVPDGRLRPIGMGRPLQRGIRARMEELFGADFSAVRVHEGPAASAMGALAFTLGEAIHFAPGLYDPASREGIELLGHELTHVVQQRAGRVTNPYGRGVAIVQDPGLEAEAEAMGRRVARSLHRGTVQRRGGRPASGRGATAQRSAPLALTDRPWNEIEALASTFGRDAVLRGAVNHVPTEEQALRGLVAPIERPLLNVGPARVLVAKYTGTWDVGQPIVQDALAIRAAWVALARRRRGSSYRKADPREGRCSEEDWDQMDEGMDVSAEIADVDANVDRNTADVQLFRAYYEGKEDVTIGILILDASGTRTDNGLHDQLVIRWLVGHPDGKGAGQALMAVATQVHGNSQYKQKSMLVTSAASAVLWYVKQGFAKLARSDCYDVGTHCGCWEMAKPAPR